MPTSFPVLFDSGEEACGLVGVDHDLRIDPVVARGRVHRMWLRGLSVRIPVSHAYSMALCKIIRLRVAVLAAAFDPVFV